MAEKAKAAQTQKEEKEDEENSVQDNLNSAGNTSELENEAKAVMATNDQI